MKKIILILLSIVVCSGLFGEKYHQKLKSGEYELILENIILKDLDFTKSEKVSVKTDAEIVIELDDHKLVISSTEIAEIHLDLPLRNSYKYQSIEKGLCTFDAVSVEIKATDGEHIIFNQDGLLVNDGTEKVRINSDGIFVDNENENVSISSEGIVVTGSDDDVNLTGIWGSMLGSVIKGVTSTAISWVGNHPEKIVKSFINDGDNDGVEINFGTTNVKGYMKEQFESTIPYDKKMKMSVKNFNGSVKIDTWDKDEIYIYAEKKVAKSKKNHEKILADTKIEIETEESYKIETTFKDKKHRATVSYEIKVPKNMDVDFIQTTNGSIIVNGTKNGSYSTTNGSLTVNFISGEFSLHTTNGSIKAVNILGTFSASTTNASIRTEDCYVIRSLSTTNGSITADFKKIESNLSISSTNGTITCYVSDIDADISAVTSNGHISLDEVSLDNQISSKNRLSGSLGSGGNGLNISTSNGNIKIIGKKRSW